MNDDIKVTVIKFGQRTNLMLSFVDPISKKKQHKSAGTHLMKQAERAAAAWESELRAGTYTRGNISWVEFKEKYENEVLTGLSPRTADKLDTVYTLIETYLNPARLRELTAERIS